MLSALESMVKVLLDLVTYIAAAAVTVLNLFFDGLTIAGSAAIELLPELPLMETHLDSTVVAQANWFFPFGGIVTTLVAMLTLYVIWMGVRYFLRLIRAA